MNRTILWTVIVVLALFLIGGLILRARAANRASQNRSTVSASPATPQAAQNQPFVPKNFTVSKTANFVSSSPSNNQVLACCPIEVKITFNRQLDVNRSTAIVRNVANNQNVSTGPGISDDGKSLIAPLQITETGNYEVTYTAGFVNGDCFNGSFGFSVNFGS